MIIKILNSASSFNAASYNIKKTDNAKGELLKYENFGALQNMPDLRPSDFKNYLKQYSSSNDKVKNKQLHFTISSKGQEKSKYELSNAAEYVLKKLGYDKNPYMIIFHNDTNNNHVHVVSSRIDENGKKIKDSFEGKKANQLIQKFLNNDTNLSFEKDLQKISIYNISNIQQYKLLFEKLGYSVKENDFDINIYKYGNMLTSINKDIITSQIQKSDFSSKKLQQLQAILHKYKTLYNADMNPIFSKNKNETNKIIGYESELTKELRKKLGLEFIFHTKNNLPAYGYTIIDHKTKTVYKGSELMKLNKLVSEKEIDKEEYTTKPNQNFLNQSNNLKTEQTEELPNIFITPKINISINDDVDDEKVYGHKRKKNKTK